MSENENIPAAVAAEMYATGEVAHTPDQQPVAAADRIVTLDFIRGIAVLGILFANITAFGHPFMAYFWPPALATGTTPADEAVWLFQFAVIDGKFRGLFTLLFGAGIYLFMERAWARGATRWLQFRRLIILMLFGLSHYFLIWGGDILTLYSVWGMVALLTLKWQPKTQLKVGIGVLAVGTLLMTVLMGMNYAAAEIPAVNAQVPEEARAQLEGTEEKILTDSKKVTAIYQDGSYADVVERQLGEWGQLVQELIFAGMGETFGLILIGSALYRLGMFHGQFSEAKLRRWGWTGVILGIALSLLAGLWPFTTGFGFFTTMFVFNGLGGVPHLMTVFGLLSLFVVYAPVASQSAIGQRFVAAGRMAFTNYLGTSILMMFVFHGWAFGLFGKLSRVELFGVVLVTWVLMLFWSKAWLARFRYGPLEWLWRCLTYGKLFPLKR